MVILTKRRKFILSSLVLSLGLIFIQLGLFSNRYIAISVLSLLTIPLVLWSLKEAVKGVIWFVSWILPLFFTLGVGFFYFLLPNSLYTGIPVIIFYFLGMYALFLSENIFSVASIRTIQLHRSSSAVSFLLSLLVSFLLFDTVLSFRFPFYYNGFLIFVVSFFIFLHGCWAINMEQKITLNLLFYSLILSMGIGEAALALSFWPATVSMSSIFLTSLVYVSMGLAQAKLSERLFPKTIKEYLGIGIAVFFILLYFTTWG